MATLLQLCNEYFGSEDLYAVLSVEKTANTNELKKAYHKLSLQVHPDRVSADKSAVATQKFQTLGRVYAILSDSESRAIYDETGEVENEFSAPADRNWEQYWRLLFSKITLQDINNFEQEYKGSEEERCDIKQAYLDGEGDMDYILDNVLCSTVDDEPRFCKLINSWIEKNEVPPFDQFVNTTKKQKDKRKRKAATEAEEAEAAKQDLGLGDSDDALKQMILKNVQNRENMADSFLDNLAAKYGKKTSTKKKPKGKK